MDDCEQKRVDYIFENDRGHVFDRPYRAIIVHGHHNFLVGWRSITIRITTKFPKKLQLSLIYYDCLVGSFYQVVLG